MLRSQYSLWLMICILFISSEQSSQLTCESCLLIAMGKENICIFLNDWQVGTRCWFFNSKLSARFWMRNGYLSSTCLPANYELKFPSTLRWCFMPTFSLKVCRDIILCSAEHFLFACVFPDLRKGDQGRSKQGITLVPAWQLYN